jgi:hypothetical protein
LFDNPLGCGPSVRRTSLIYLFEEFLMSVRVTERLIGDVVIVPGLPNGPRMVVQSIDEGAKMVTTTWFSDNHEGQEGSFPGSALDRVEQPSGAAGVKGKKAAGGRRGRKPAK